MSLTAVSSRALVVLAMAVSTLVRGPSRRRPFKVAWFNIQSGKGEPGMAGHLSASPTPPTAPTPLSR